MDYLDAYDVLGLHFKGYETMNGYKECPCCRRDIQEDSIVCGYCGYLVALDEDWQAEKNDLLLKGVHVK